MTLADIRGDLIRQEETIIFALIERSQFAMNDPIYVSGAASPIYARGGQDGAFGPSPRSRSGSPPRSDA